jgi:hypothetical protein
VNALVGITHPNVYSGEIHFKTFVEPRPVLAVLNIDNSE